MTVRQKKARKYATMKRILKPNKKEKKDPTALKERELGPPYHILVDTNFINFSIKAKLDLVQSMMDCLYAKLALRIAKDPRFERLPCTHKGTYLPIELRAHFWVLSSVPLIYVSFFTNIPDEHGCKNSQQDISQ
ncbi:unnamed protein product [Nyctereutes procyonoides]|uniref:(raccoon dog) hypothetical protein n=1 Tax=Nyctereutes procyonoides TaxID=34880 RepID=A0A811Y580_NYCPR|nr:unnamed protein product [Nyctereutes procyonoides]